MAQPNFYRDRKSLWQRLVDAGIDVGSLALAIPTGGATAALTLGGNAAINALGTGHQQGTGHDTKWYDYIPLLDAILAPEERFDIEGLNDYLSGQLNQDALDFWNSVSDSDKEALLSNYFDKNNDFSNLWGVTGTSESLDVSDLISDLNQAANSYQSFEAPTQDDIYKELENNKFYQDRLDELAALEERSTNLFENQLQENQMMFDDYRSQVLGNQYRQNAQLLGTVGSEMDRARRNALEAGASAGLRMAENINTTLALQNKQSQISLETSNQLAQQLLNQRQAAAGIRSDYNQMLSDNADKRESTRQNYYSQAKESAWDKYYSDKDKYVNTRATGLNPIAEQYDTYKNNKSQSQYN